MVLTVDGIEYGNIIVSSLKRSITVATGSNNGTLLSGERFNDVRHSYYQYTLTINPSLADHTEYEELYALLSKPIETHEIIVPYGQGTVTFNACVKSVSDNCKKILPNQTIWEGFSVTFEGTEAIQ